MNQPITNDELERILKIYNGLSDHAKSLRARQQYKREMILLVTPRMIGSIAIELLAARNLIKSRENWNICQTFEYENAMNKACREYDNLIESITQPTALSEEGGK